MKSASLPPGNRTDNLRLSIHHGVRPVCAEESRWVDYLIPLNPLIGYNNAATKLITCKQWLFFSFLLYNVSTSICTFCSTQKSHCKITVSSMENSSNFNNNLKKVILFYLNPYHIDDTCLLGYQIAIT